MMYGSWQMDRRKKWHGVSPKNENWAYLWINRVTFYRVCFYCMPSWGLSKYIKTKQQTACLNLIQSFFFFLKKKGDLEPVSLSHFCITFEEKYLSCYLLLTDQISFSCCLCFMRYWVICVLQLFVNQAVMW